MQKHGAADIYWLENLLVVETYGPFNEEGVEAIIEQAKKAVNNRQAQSWSRLEILDDETLGSLAVVEKVKNMYTWFEANGCRHTAVVVSNSVQEYVTENLLLSKVKIFRDLETAKKWLQENS